MTRPKYFATLAIGSMLAISSLGFSQAGTTPKTTTTQSATKKQSKVLTSVTRGTVKSMSDTQLVVDKKVKGKQQDATFVMDTSTQKQGNIAVGTPVTVRYRHENSQDIATMVRVDAPKRASK